MTAAVDNRRRVRGPDDSAVHLLQLRLLAAKRQVAAEHEGAPGSIAREIAADEFTALRWAIEKLENPKP